VALCMGSVRAVGSFWLGIKLCPVMLLFLGVVSDCRGDCLI